MTSFGPNLMITAGILLFAGAAAIGSTPVTPKAPESDKIEAAQGNNAFALELYRELSKKDGNLFLSPASISTALAMTYAGARGETASQMAKTLHFSLSPDRLHSAQGGLVRDLNSPGKKRGYDLSVANSLWLHQGRPFSAAFLQLNQDNYGAELQTLDFKNATEQSRQTINAWVEKHTNDKIKELLKPGILDPDTALVLTNAIYFKGSWALKFKKEQTKDGPFHLASGTTVQAPMMNQHDRFPYLNAGSYKMLELPYQGKELSMLLILPAKKDGLADLEKSLTPKMLSAAMVKLHETSLPVKIPRFKMTSEFKLNDKLIALGMPLAFDSSRADFSGIDGEPHLYISAVVHKAFVDVNEEGSEAAAATAVLIMPMSAPIGEPASFIADHPFFFAIRDKASGSILFMGRVADPSK